MNLNFNYKSIKSLENNVNTKMIKMIISIAELGNALRCPKKDCDRFGKITKLSVSNDKVTLELICENHMNKYKRIYSINQFIRLADSALIDKPWVIAFQKHMMVRKGQFIQLRGGLEGAFFIKNTKIVKTDGPKLICKCGSFASVTFVKAKKDKVEVNLYCSTCMPKGKKIWLPAISIIELGRAGIVDSTLVQKVKEEFADDGEEFDVSTAYSIGKGIMANWVQEDLGVLDDGGGSKKCYICGTRVSDTMDKCPKCGSDL